MNATRDSASHKQFILNSQRVVAIDFKELCVNDIILIGTLNTCYRFVLTSEKGMQGRLSGDSPNDFFPEAVLIGSLVNEGEQVRIFRSRLEPSSQALFYVKQGEQLLELLTSSITSLCCVRPVRG
jgi:hypothetical protein